MIFARQASEPVCEVVGCLRVVVFGEGVIERRWERSGGFIVLEDSSGGRVVEGDGIAIRKRCSSHVIEAGSLVCFQENIHRLPRRYHDICCGEIFDVACVDCDYCEGVVGNGEEELIVHGYIDHAKEVSLSSFYYQPVCICGNIVQHLGLSVCLLKHAGIKDNSSKLRVAKSDLT